MSKFNQKIILFIEPSDKAYDTPAKIGNLFMNRFAIDEYASHEILKIYHLEHQFNPLWNTVEKGMDLINKGTIVHDS